MPPEQHADRPPHHPTDHPHRPQDRYPQDYCPPVRRQERPSVGSIVGTCAIAGFHLWLLYRVIRMSSQTNELHKALVESK